MRYARHCLMVWWAMLLLVQPGRCQSSAIDSLQHLLQQATADTDKIALNYSLENMLSGYDLSKASVYLENGYRLAKAVQSRYYVVKYHHIRATLLTSQSQYDEALAACDTAIAGSEQLIHAKKVNRYTVERCRADIAQTLVTKGLICAKQYKYNESIQYYLKSIGLFEAINNPDNNSSVAHIYTSISSNYYELEQFDDALIYDKMALPYLSKEQNIDLFVIGYLFVADDYSSLSKFDSSYSYLEKVRPIVQQLNKPNLNVRFHYILGGIYRKQEHWKDALYHFQMANAAAQINKDAFQGVNSAEGMAACYLQLGNIEKARSLATLVLHESEQLNIPLGKMQGLQLLVQIEEKSGNTDKAYRYENSFITISDSVKKEKTKMQMNETEAKYQSEKKQHEILRLEKDKQLQLLSIKQSATLNYILVGSLAAVLLMGVLLYRTYRQRQQLQQQKIAELEKDRQLMAVDAMLKGQEEERSRLAKDLHDGLGGMLSGVKYSLHNMRDNVVATPENMAAFERSVAMIDNSVKELRRIAHNMMPEMLTRFGLDEALKEYCNAVNATKMITVQYQSFGMDMRLDSSVEIIIYRIVQELLSNVLKHAAASAALVQLIRENNRLHILVEDDGSGFDAAILDTHHHAGWNNIRSRVDYLKGRLELNPEPGKGTSVSIEFTV